ncbi:NADH-quinone oxidoreductase subunit J [Candidatus Saganbacteria bacterium]|nr:NADH-quinone oxidoreductase subunit J [Candidatus Saganbacteria bacterium]
MIFYFLAVTLILSAILVVTLKNIFHCALFLIVAILAIAGLYFHLQAPFLGVVQLIIYIGAIMVLILFAIMLTSRISDRLLQTASRQSIPALLAVIVFILLALKSLDKTPLPAHIGKNFDPILDLGRALMTAYVLPFEVVSLLLLVALVGAIALARKD